MKTAVFALALLPAFAISLTTPEAAARAGDRAGVGFQADTWRAEHRLIDLHQHIDYTEEHLARAVRIMDRVGLGIGVNLSGSTTTQKAGEKSAFERNKGLAVASAVEPHAERTRGRTFSKTNASDRRIVACFGLGAGLA